jgi:outer membrane protein W
VRHCGHGVRHRECLANVEGIHDVFSMVFVFLPTTMIPRLLSLALLLFTLPAIAQQPQNEVAVSAGYSSLGDLGSAPAFGVSYTRFWTDALAIRFGAFSASGDLDDGGTKIASAYHASAEYHFRRTAPVSLHVGAGLALATTSVDGLPFDFSASETSPEVIVSAGVDMNVSPRFALGADVHYMYYDVELGARSGYQVNPATLLISGKYRF